MNFYCALFLSCLTLHLQATYPKKTLFKPNQPEYIQLNTIVIEQAEPSSPITLGLKKITAPKPEVKQPRKKITSQEKEALAQKAKTLKQQSIERAKQWIETRNNNPMPQKQNFISQS